MTDVDLRLQKAFTICYSVSVKSSGRRAVPKGRAHS